MMEAPRIPLIAEDADRIDDCWNRIGVQGDRSCVRLVEHVHCRNCEVHAEAATHLLDRYALVRQEPEAGQADVAVSSAPASGRLLLLFRLGQEWLALATACLAEIAPMQTIHSLPHQRSQALQGVANARGVLVPCLSLSALLQIDPGPSPATTRRCVPRMLTLTTPQGAVVLPVDEVDGIHRLGDDAQPNEGQAVPFTTALVHWRDRTVRVLDPQQVVAAVNRSLS
ncbi:MAG: chemotaxis protein CheW [Pseudomonas sp.]|jgi:chemotaxis-related protein WspD|nr:chemotaxis protein CheW [Pseudomonas sp.]